MSFTVQISKNFSELPVYTGTLQNDTDGNQIDFGDALAVVPCYMLLEGEIIGGGVDTEYVYVSELVDGETTVYSVTRDVRDLHTSAIEWPAGTSYTYADKAENLPPTQMSPIGATTLAAPVIGTDTQITFTTQLTVGAYLRFLGYASGGTEIAAEWLRVERLVSGSGSSWTYKVARDVRNENVSPPGWAPGLDIDVYMPTNLFERFEVIDVVKPVPGSIKLSTQLNGGYASCSFDVAGTVLQNIQRRTTYLGADVVVYDHSGYVAWEGFITGLALSKTFDVLSVTAMGHFARANHLYFGVSFVQPEATKNYIPNPSFELNALWTHVGSICSGGGYSGVTDAEALFGSYSYQVPQPYFCNNADPDFIGTYIDVPIDPSLPYTLSFYVKGSGIRSVVPRVCIYDAYNTVYQIGSAYNIRNISSGWSRYSFSFNATSSNRIRIQFEYPPSLEMDPVTHDYLTGTIWIDGVQLEQLSYATAYCDGSLSGCAWLGTAHDSQSTRSAEPVYGSDVLVAAVGMMDQYWSQHTEFLSGSDYDVTDQDFSDKRVKDGIETVLSYGVTRDGLPYNTYFVIYNNRIPRIVLWNPSNVKVPTWVVDASHSKDTVGVSLDVSSVYNKVYSVYNDSEAGQSVTEASGDFISQRKYGVREGFLNNGDLPYSLTQSLFLQEAALRQNKDPKAQWSFELIGSLNRFIGVRENVYKVRAGDVILVVDSGHSMNFIDTISFSSKQAIASLRLVMSTDYDEGSDTLRISVGDLDPSLEAVFTRLGLSGGLQ